MEPLENLITSVPVSDRIIAGARFIVFISRFATLLINLSFPIQGSLKYIYSQGVTALNKPSHLRHMNVLFHLSFSNNTVLSGESDGFTDTESLRKRKSHRQVSIRQLTSSTALRGSCCWTPAPGRGLAEYNRHCIAD